MDTLHRQTDEQESLQADEGFVLLTALVMIFLVLLTLSIAAPRIAKDIQRDREVESQHRAEQYVRAVRIFYLKFKRYPTSIEQLEKTNNQRFLRQRYVDPLTGKDDWRLIHVGENKTQVKGFFGDDLPGLPTGLGSAAGLASPTGTSAFGQTGSNSTSAFNNNTPGSSGLGGSSPTGGTGTSGIGQSGATGTGTSGSASNTNGISSQNATDATGSGGGPIIGVGSNKSGEAILIVNEQTTYDTWEFLYDPRIEQLYAKGSLLGGIASGTGTSGFGTNPGTGTGTNQPGAPNGLGNSNGFGTNGTFGNSGTTGAGSGTGTSGTIPPP